jgi:hypothetical protein
LLLAGRGKASKELEEKLQGPPQIITLAGPSLDEVRAFAAGVAVDAAGSSNGKLLARMAFVDERATWRQLLDSPTPLVLIPMSEGLADEVPPGCTHHVIVPVSHRETADVVLPQVDATEAKEVLLAMGLEEKRADALSRLAKRSIMALRRNLAVKPALHLPAWASSQASRLDRAALLAGSWSEKVVGDQSALAEMAGVAYENLRDRLSALGSDDDPLVITVGGSWHLVSPFDAWLLLSPQVTQDDLKRLEAITERVLGETDPALDMSPKDRWKANIEGKVSEFSSDLRRGLARSLALLAVHGESIKAMGSSNGTEWASHLVRKLLEDANRDPSGHRWASLSGLLPILAEASPDVFLEAVRGGLRGDDPLLAKLFTDSKQSDPLTTHSSHTGLLWALEATAWSTEHFGASVDLLARLAAIDPGGKLSNRPFHSLVEIFCPWHPETSVGPDRRLVVVDTLRERHPDCAWRLMMKMLPEPHGVHMPTHEPQFRDWKPVRKPQLVTEYVDFIGAVVDRAITDAGGDATRWTELLGKVSDFPPSDRSKATDALRRLVESDGLGETGRKELWSSVRSTVGRHVEYAHTDWALPADEVARLEELANALKPEDTFDSTMWLFEDHSPALGDINRGDDYEAYERALAEHRREAVKLIYEDSGLKQIRRLGTESKVPWAVGDGLASAAGSHVEANLLPLLTNGNSSDLDVANGYFGRMFRDQGWEWLDQLVSRSSGLTDAEHARLLLCARDFPIAWDKAAAAGPGVATEFWKSFVPYGLGPKFKYLEHVANQLKEVGRHSAALDLLGIYMFDEEYRESETMLPLVVDALNGFLAGATSDKEIHLLSHHDFERLFAYLESKRDDVGREALATLEWAFLPALGFEPKVPTLHERMATTPDCFLEVLSIVFKSRSGEHEELTEEESAARQELATNGYRLLSSWKHPPGLIGGKLDVAAFMRWLEEAKPLLQAADRYEIGMSQLGHALFGVPADEDGTWPSEGVRDLLERLQSEEVEEGFYVEILNSRGVTSRGLEDGGKQERDLVKKYRTSADQFADKWPQTATILRNVAQRYETDARRNDESSERFREGLDF